MVKRRDQAKSRLAVPAPLRAALAEAMLRDVLAAVRPVAPVTVVTPDPSWGRLGAPLLGEPGRGLSIAVAHAARVAAGGPVAVLVADMPALRPAELAAALAAAREVPWGLVADTAGTGTALLAARDAAALRPAFGPGSRSRHRAAGAADLTGAADVPGLRRDVDTLADLRAAAALGVGQATARLLAAHPGLRGPDGVRDAVLAEPGGQRHCG
ncbi:MAG TPA: 2-phospho-L-lactate guanylyltransferase [Pilimelia sp.]|nr:2-phospho-L-lactate guanylyltransferase [Pilimelia sp.]